MWNCSIWYSRSMTWALGYILIVCCYFKRWWGMATRSKSPAMSWDAGYASVVCRCNGSPGRQILCSEISCSGLNSSHPLSVALVCLYGQFPVAIYLQSAPDRDRLAWTKLPSAHGALPEKLTSHSMLENFIGTRAVVALAGRHIRWSSSNSWLELWAKKSP